MGPSIVALMETILVERSDGVATVTLNRPKRKNAVDATMWRELLGTFRDISANPIRDRAVVITGAGGEFCSGADLSGSSSAADRMQPIHTMRVVAQVALALHRLPQPTIAKVRGVAVGAGCNMALACDLIVCADDARFSQIFHRRGLSVDFGGTWLLPRLIGLHRAKELALFADIISAQDAKEIGLVNRVLSNDELDGFVDGWAARLAAGPPNAMAQSKRLLNDSFEMTLDQAVEAEGTAQALNIVSKDAAEALAAFLEKRDPVFRGA